MRQFSPQTCNAMLMTTKHCKLLVDMLQLASQSCEDSSVFSVTCFAIFRCVASCRDGVLHSHIISSATCFAMALHCRLKGKLPCLRGPLQNWQIQGISVMN